MAHANSVTEWGDLATLARGMHMWKSLVGYPRDMDAFIGLLCARREHVNAYFHCRVCLTLIFCYKIANVA